MLDYFDYDFTTGIGTYKKRKGKRVKIGDRVGYIDTSNGYRYVCFEGKTYKEHRVVWFLYYGEWPKNEIDHIDLNKANNAISNLRECTRSQNLANRKTVNKLGFKGVQKTPYGKYQAKIKKGGKLIYLGTYETPEEASIAYGEAATKHFGNFANF